MCSGQKNRLWQKSTELRTQILSFESELQLLILYTRHSFCQDPEVFLYHPMPFLAQSVDHETLNPRVVG